MALPKPEDWIKFVRRYGPVPRNDNQFDEQIQRAARKLDIRPLRFDHPLQKYVADSFDGTKGEPRSVILTGEAGDGKTHLCREVWENQVPLKEGADPWSSEGTAYGRGQIYTQGRQVSVHVIRDLSDWVQQRGRAWDPVHVDLLVCFSRSLFRAERSDYFLIAANDGQLLESWRRLQQYTDDPSVPRALALFEDLLFEHRSEEPGVALRFFNLSDQSSATLLDEALRCLLARPEWDICFGPFAPEDSAFGSRSPIRKNLEILRTPLFQKRLRCLFELCDHNRVHIPLRQILLLLSNALLGHPDAEDGLMLPSDVARIISQGTTAAASIYGNVFGSNIVPETRRLAISIFNDMDRFRVGLETTNRVDSLVIFGEANEMLRPYYEELLGKDRFYGAHDVFIQARDDYIEGNEEDSGKTARFLDQLVAQRRALFFKIFPESENDLQLWDLTVFKYAGEYLSDVIQVLRRNETVNQPILHRLVLGLNRIFLGMLVENNDELILATSLALSNAKVSQILEERISVEDKPGEGVEIESVGGAPALVVRLSSRPEHQCSLTLNLTRFEFLSRVADGALPNSFSKECYEDLLSFKSRVLAALEARRESTRRRPSQTARIRFRRLYLDQDGRAKDKAVEV